MKYALICLLVLMAGVAGAETVTLRSGEHPGFSRLVLTIPAGTDWQLGRSGRDYALQLAPQTGFDISAAFDRIPRDRLRELLPVPGTGRLILELGCECHATGFLFTPEHLVIDISDGLPSPDSPFEAALDTNMADGDMAASTPEMDPLRGLALLPDPMADATRNAPRVAAAEVALLDSLAHAATQGLLDIDRSVPPVSHSESPDALFPMPAPTMWSDEAVFPVGPPSPGISVQTSIDRARPALDVPATTRSGTDCLDDRLFDLAAWGDGTGFSAQIGTRLSALTTERDLVPEGMIEALAQTYIFFGFGAEAEQALGLDGRRSPERDVLRSIARIIDERPPDSTVLDDQVGCERPVALWVALARGTVADTTEAERIAIQSAHRVLPLSLRRPIGTRLAQLFLNAGAPATAQGIIATGNSEREPLPPGPTLTGAEVALAMDTPQTAFLTLEELTSDPSRTSPEAVAALINLSLDNGRGVNDDLLQAASTLRFENRGSPVEIELAIAMLRAMASAGNYSAALSFLAEEVPDFPADLRQEQITSIIAAAADKLPDGDFLDFAFAPLAVPPSGGAENALAARLLDLGFPEAAAQLVAGPAETRDMALRRRLRARANVALGLSAEGAADLSGMTDAASRAILGQSEESDPSILWRVGDWSDLGAAEDPLLQAASRAMLQGSVALSPDATLAERQTLLDEAAATRDLATELLARFAIVPATDPTN